MQWTFRARLSQLVRTEALPNRLEQVPAQGRAAMVIEFEWANDYRCEKQMVRF